MPLGDQCDDTLDAQKIDELIESTRVKAEQYAAEPDRFQLSSLELELRSAHGNRLIIYEAGQWSCTCSFFEEWGRCSHTMATLLLLKDSLFTEQEEIHD